MTAPPPYPTDTQAKGWRFELDLERIRQSDTWALASAEQRPWLLMLWATAWEQSPCGSLPNDDVLIAARIGMKPAAFKKVRDVLLRGWWLADDGRLYHKTVTGLVMAMIEKKEKDRTRKAGYRARKRAETDSDGQGGPDMSHGTDEGQTQDGSGTDAGIRPERQHQAPSTKHQKKQSSSAAASHADTPAHEGHDSTPPAPPDGQGQSEAAAPPVGQTREQAIAVWLRQAEKARGKQPTGTASSDPRIAAWAEHGVTDAQLAEAYELAVADREKCQDLGPIGPGFLDIFVGKLLNPSAAASAVNKRPAASDPLAWATTWSGIVAKGAEHGLTQCEGEANQAFRVRVHAAAGLTAADKSRLLADFGVRA